MKKVIYITREQNEYYNKLLSMTGDEIYAKYGLKRGETIVHTANFGNDLEMDIELVICGGEDRPYVDAILFENGYELCHTDVEEIFIGNWDIEHQDEKYIVEIRVEPDELQLSELNDGDIVYGFAFEVATDGKRHNENTIAHKLFCKPTKGVIEKTEWDTKNFIPLKNDGSRQKSVNAEIRRYTTTEEDAIFLFNKSISEKIDVLLHKVDLLSEYLIEKE